MAEELKKPTSSPSTKKPTTKTNNSTIIFFVLLIVGLVVLTIIVLMKKSSSESRVFVADYGNRYRFLIEVFSNGNVDLAVDMSFDEDGDGKFDRVDRILQSGKCEEIKDTEKSEDSENTIEKYKITFIEESNDETTEEKSEPVETNAEIHIENDTLTLIYEDGIEIVFKEIIEDDN